MKVIKYRGGVVIYRIPDNWVEEYEDEGGGTFYEDCPDSGTLRLNVISFKAQSKPTPDVIKKALMSSKDSSIGKINFLPNGNGVLNCRKCTSEENRRLTIYYWEVAHPIPPDHFDYAIFSYTILEDRESDPQIQAELSMLDQEIRASIFSPRDKKN